MGTAWLDWVATHSNVDNALDRLDELTSGTARLEEAMVAYREALEVFTLDTVPHSQAQAGLKRVTEILESRNV